MTTIEIERLINKDWEALYCASLSSEYRNNLRTSLILEDKGENGSNIVWKSSDNDVINGFGRVIKPKSGDEPKEVTLTATLELLGHTKSFELDFCVKPDDVFYDPGYISDADFFSLEKDKAFIDYDIVEFANVKKAAELVDFKTAKQELFNYFKAHNRKPYLGEKKDSNMVEMMVGGMQCLQRSDRLYRGKITSNSTEYETKTVAVSTQGICIGQTLSLAMVSRFCECCALKIAGKDYADEKFRPQLNVKTDAGEYTFDCKDDSILCPTKEVRNDTGELYVKNFGKFLGDETYVSILKFDIEIPAAGAIIEEVSLKLSVKKEKNLNGTKEAYIVLFADNLWEGKTAKWNDFLWQFANRTDVEEKDAFDVEEGFDFEYFFQRVRFMYFNWAALEYEETHDEGILYSLIRTMCSFIEAKGDMRRYSKNWHGMGWYNDEVNQSLTAGWPRALDAASRLQYFAETLPYLTQSKYMTPEILCCALKYIRDGIHGVIYKSTTQPRVNLRMFELMGAMRALSVYPEFSRSKEFFNNAAKIVENMMQTITFADGTYMETTGGYSQGVCSDYVRFYKMCNDNGIVLSDEFLERLYKFAMYNVLLQGPDGESLQYGDQNAEKFIGWQYPALIDACNDEKLKFILTRGDLGTAPEWKSYRFSDSSATMLRDGWNKNATYLWTQARGGGSHGHQDDHHISLISNKRTLLCDAGVFTYSEEDPYRQWGISAIAHNTVAIDGIPQKRGSGSGKVQCFKTSDDIDEVCQTSFAYPGFEFTRHILWNKKENVIFVEDTLVPDDVNTEYTYRQAWHMMPTSGIVFDNGEKIMYSDYNGGVNIRISSLDTDTVLKKEEGWYDYGYQQLTDNPFGCFVKENIKGKVSFKTKIEIFD